MFSCQQSVRLPIGQSVFVSRRLFMAFTAASVPTDGWSVGVWTPFVDRRVSRNEAANTRAGNWRLAAHLTKLRCNAMAVVIIRATHSYTMPVTEVGSRLTTIEDEHLDSWQPIDEARIYTIARDKHPRRPTDGKSAPPRGWWTLTGSSRESQWQKLRLRQVRASGENLNKLRVNSAHYLQWPMHCIAIVECAALCEKIGQKCSWWDLQNHYQVCQTQLRLICFGESHFSY